MNHYSISDHSWKCEKNHNNKNYCSRNKKSFLFYAKQDFWLISYNPCLSSGDHFGNMYLIIKSLFKSDKTYSGNIKKWYNLNDEFKEYRLRNASLETSISEINYTYYIKGEEYCFYTETDYFEVNNKTILENYNIAVDYLSKNGFGSLLEYAEKLKKINLINENYIAKELNKTLDYTLKQLNKQINEKHRKGKHKVATKTRI